MRFGKNVFMVTFYGNEDTPRERVNDFALLRSADLALVHGYYYFVILTKHEYEERVIITTPSDSDILGSPDNIGNPFIKKDHTADIEPHTFNIDSAREAITIEAFVERPEGKRHVYDARAVLNSITGKYPAEFR